MGDYRSKTLYIIYSDSRANCYGVTSPRCPRLFALNFLIRGHADKAGYPTAINIKIGGLRFNPDNMQQADYE